MHIVCVRIYNIFVCYVYNMIYIVYYKLCPLLCEVALHTRMIYSQAVIIVQIWYKHGITMGWDLANFV